MKRMIRILVCFVFCAFMITACDSKGNGTANAKEISYEPDTAVALPATVAYEIKNAGSLPQEKDAWPNSAFVWVDDRLQILDKSGNAVFFSLQEFLPAIKNAVPGLYIESDAAAQALLSYLKANDRQDVIVAARAKNAPLIHKIKKELPAIRGLIDFSETKQVFTREELGQAVALTNAGGAKMVLLSYQSATREAVKYLQSRLITVWVRVSNAQEEILTQLTNGVNGLMAENYESVYDALSLFQADIPILLRTPLIIGHRGLPSQYVENTLRSEKAAQEAGADLLEYDIYLSSDREIFVLHDSAMKRLFNRPDIGNVEAMTLAQLQAIPFDGDSANGVQAKNHTPAKDSTKGVIAVSPEDRIPALRELFEAFKNTDILHLVEIKSQNPDIVVKLKALAEECGVVDQMAVISFNVPILRAMAESWPEMSLGCLGYDDARGRSVRSGKTLDPEKEMPYENHAKMVEEAGGDSKSAVLALNHVIGLYNGTYNPSYAGISYPTVASGRHMGLTAWPWTYNTPSVFAKDYLFGMYGLTTNFATWASNLPESFTASDGEMTAGSALSAEAVFSPVIQTHDGGRYAPEDIELAVVQNQDVLKEESGVIAAQAPGESLILLRVRVPLLIDGKDYGAYYIYSNPVTLTVKP